jgi:LacI family transcriptional regulator
MKTQNLSEKEKKPQVTMADIAARAGVAVSTVSRVINRSPLVAPEKRIMIESVIAEMGYKAVPVEKRKGIRKDPSPWIKYHTLKVVLFGKYDLYWITNYAPIFSYALHGIEEALTAYHFRRELERAESKAGLLKVLDKGGADGFLILNTSHEPLPEEICNYPVAVFMGSHDHLSCDRVMPNAERAGVLAAEYLQSKECRACIAIGGDTPIYRKRIKAFCETLSTYGIQAVEILDENIERGGSRINQANRALIADRVMPKIDKANKPIGIFSVADLITPVLYSIMTEAGFKVGHDLHIVSCNNERPYLDHLYPPPAVIDTQADYIGQRVVRQLLRRLENPNSPHEIVLIDPKLILPDAF